ncbi:hypothetical protein T439DRAFT_322375 [Meredithblackwellia eburnea MCA 4105]
MGDILVHPINNNNNLQQRQPTNYFPGSDSDFKVNFATPPRAMQTDSLPTSLLFGPPSSSLLGTTTHNHPIISDLDTLLLKLHGTTTTNTTTSNQLAWPPSPTSTTDSSSNLEEASSSSDSTTSSVANDTSSQYNNNNNNNMLTIGQLLRAVPDFELPSLSNSGLNGVEIAAPARPARGMPFIKKLRGLLLRGDLYGDALVWDQEGECFIVSTTSKRLTDDILPKTFGHHNVSSFNRQLNVYGFHRLPTSALSELLDPSVPTSSYAGWRHPSFSRDGTAWTTMTPRPSKARKERAERRERGGV